MLNPTKNNCIERCWIAVTQIKTPNNQCPACFSVLSRCQPMFGDFCFWDIFQCRWFCQLELAFAFSHTFLCVLFEVFIFFFLKYWSHQAWQALSMLISSTYWSILWIVSSKEHMDKDEIRFEHFSLSLF